MATADRHRLELPWWQTAVFRDTIYASVTYTGPTSSGAQKFQLLIVDYASGGSGTRVTENVQTGAGVQLLDTARQGLVEDIDAFSAFGVPIPSTGGLAQFSQPIQFAQWSADGEPSGELRPETSGGHGTALGSSADSSRWRACATRAA
jgi:hypothetical protein